ncbi:phage head morphogenesis protein [Betaproteobacteria bacterium]|nr:phage head morphogenesis protein [Betaproteobacteria bacterium]
MAALGGAFNQEFKEAVEFFRQKEVQGTLRWDSIWQSAHNHSFVVAGAMKTDLLADLQAAVAPLQKQSLETFRKNFFALVEKHDWHGWTGEGTEKGRAWRTRVIFETNVSTAYAAGRWKQLNDPDLLKILPFWKYVHDDGVKHPRLPHKHWGDIGLTLPHDHPFWKTHFPPNGWFCHCRVTAVKQPAAGDATEPPEGWNAIDKKTGAPRGIDKGWAYAPGASVSDGIRKIMAEKAAALPEQLSKDILETGLSSKAFADWYASPSKGTAWPMARIPDEDAQAIGAKNGVRVGHFSDETAIKQRREHPDLTPEDYTRAQDVIDRHTNKAQDGPNNMIYVRETAGDNGGYVLVVKATQTGKALWVTSFRRLHRKEAAQDSEIRRLLKKERK